MKVQVLYFGYIREKIGIGEESFEIGGNLADLIREVQRKHSGLIELVEGILTGKSDVALAVNTNISKDLSYIVKDMDEIAFIPPISGG